MTPQLTKIIEHLLHNDLLLLVSLGVGYAMILTCCITLSAKGLKRDVKLKQVAATTAVIVAVQIAVGLIQIYALPGSDVACLAATCVVTIAFVLVIRAFVADSTKECIEVFLLTVVHMTLVGVVLVIPLSLHLFVSWLKTEGG